MARKAWNSKGTQPIRFMRKKILLVDDDHAVRESVARVLTGEDYEVLPAANGLQALDIAAGTKVDLVLLDLNMPEKSGWDTFERLTNDNPLTPVVIITARPNQLFLARAAGAGALMEKPLDFPKLLETMKELLAEPAEHQLDRIAGKARDFHYFPTESSRTSKRRLEKSL